MRCHRGCRPRARCPTAFRSSKAPTFSTACGHGRPPPGAGAQARGLRRNEPGTPPWVMNAPIIRSFHTTCGLLRLRLPVGAGMAAQHEASALRWVRAFAVSATTPHQGQQVARPRKLCKCSRCAVPSGCSVATKRIQGPTMFEHRVNQSDHYPSKYASIKRHRAIAAQSIHPSESL